MMCCITELGEEAIENPAKRYALAEEYANGGIEELYEEFNENEDRFNEVLYQHLLDTDKQLNGGLKQFIKNFFNFGDLDVITCIYVRLISYILFKN